MPQGNAASDAAEAVDAAEQIDPLMPYEERHAPPGEEPLPAETDDFYDSGKAKDGTVDKGAAAGPAAGRMVWLADPVRA